MDALLSRYRNLTVLLIVVVAQLLYLAYQVKTNRDERLLRVWAVTTVTPMAGIVEAVRRNTIGFLEDYFILLDVREQNQKLRSENARLKMENVEFRNELATAERARALAAFQQRTPSRTVAARVTGNSTVSSAKAVFIDRGSSSGVENGMAVVTPDGIVGKIIAVYPLASQILLVTDPTFAVGVESQRNHAHGILQCDGSRCMVNTVQNEEKVEPGEMFFTSGEDRIFPKGFPVGKVTAVHDGHLLKDITLELSGAPGSAEEVLVVLEGVHRAIPEVTVARNDVKLLPPPPDEGKKDDKVRLYTEADKIREHYEQLGKAQNHVFGAPGSTAPNFNIDLNKPVPASGANGVTAPNGAAVKPPAAGIRPPAPGPAASQPGAAGRPNAAAPVPKRRPVAPIYPLGAPRPKTAPESAPPSSVQQP